MIVLELALLAQAHHPQGGADGANAGGQNRADKQDFGPFPNRFAKGQFKVAQHEYNSLWQVAHGSPFLAGQV